MKPLTVITTYTRGPHCEKTLLSLALSKLIEAVLVICPATMDINVPKCRVWTGGTLQSQTILSRVIREANTEGILLLTGVQEIIIDNGVLERFITVAESTRAGIVYSDFYEETGQGKAYHPLNDYQFGSVRDDFNFGSMMLFSTEAVRKALEKHGAIPKVSHAALYDLRLKVSIDHPIHHLSEPLYSVANRGDDSGDARLFAYVDPRNVDAQKEMELVFTDYLKRIGAYLPPDLLRYADQSTCVFPVEASVIIPVRNRAGTIADAVQSALSQVTDFPFNVIVIDNHSTDGTTSVLSGLAGRHGALKHIIPSRTDLGIGGCWNEAINSPMCGRYSVQLDSDDFYSGTGTLQRIVDTLRKERCAMVIGSYTLINANMEEIPPGLIDHREWTDDNGHNNALRVNGLGAPRAFDTTMIRKVGFLNVSYGEDYAAALNICREYRIGRIFESMYLCRRWEGNTDAALSAAKANENDAFKDSIRTSEMLARQEMNRRRQCEP